jgi:hypothetical protein
MMSSVGEWTDEQLNNAMRYGVCSICGDPREELLTRDESGRPTHLDLICPNGHGEADWVEEARVAIAEARANDAAPY